MPSPSPAPEDAPEANSPPHRRCQLGRRAGDRDGARAGVFECVRDEAEQYTMQDGWLRPCVGPY